MLQPDEPTLSDISRDLGTPLSTVQREVARLERAGILTTKRRGRGRTVAVDATNPAVPPLLELVAITFGPRRIIVEVFGDIAGIESLYLFGSWAARYVGAEGPPPGDVDVLVIGDPDRDDIYDAADRAQRRLRRDVNTTLVSTERWSTADEPFLTEVRDRPLIRLDTDGDAA